MSEGVCEAPTFMEWSTNDMVVQTYPEGGSAARLHAEPAMMAPERC